MEEGNLSRAKPSPWGKPEVGSRAEGIPLGEEKKWDDWLTFNYSLIWKSQNFKVQGFQGKSQMGQLGTWNPELQT